MREARVVPFYEQVKASAFKDSSHPVHVFISASEVDSLAACKVVAHIFNSDGIKYSLYPVSGYDDIKRYREGLQGDAESYTAVFINCGGTEDMVQKLGVGELEYLFVIDSHRPLHLNNLNNYNKQVTVLYPEEQEQEVFIEGDVDISKWELDQLEDVARIINEEDDEDQPMHEFEEDQFEMLKQRLGRRGEYYQIGSYYGQPAGLALYNIAEMLRKETNEMLWYACVSVTDQLVHLRINKHEYDTIFNDLEMRVRPSSDQDRMALMDDLGTSVRIPEKNRIESEDEPQLALLREWSLYDSLMRSPYSATRLQTWKESGEELKLLLAEMGMALKECRQKYAYMSSELKRDFKDAFQNLADKHGLGELYYRSFQMLNGLKSVVSAADVVYAATAILEGWEDDSKDWTDHFWDAVCALSPNDHENFFSKGIERAIHVNLAIYRQASLLLVKEKDGLRAYRASKFYHAKLDDLADTDMLQHPMALSKLVHFLLEAQEVMYKSRRKQWPVLVTAAGPSKPMVLILAISHKPKIEQAEGNKFGEAFQQVASILNCNHRHDSFDSSWIWVAKAEADRFIEELVYRLAEV